MLLSVTDMARQHGHPEAARGGSPYTAQHFIYLFAVIIFSSARAIAQERIDDVSRLFLLYLQYFSSFYGGQSHNTEAQMGRFIR